MLVPFVTKPAYAISSSSSSWTSSTFSLEIDGFLPYRSACRIPPPAPNEAKRMSSGRARLSQSRGAHTTRRCINPRRAQRFPRLGVDKRTALTWRRPPSHERRAHSRDPVLRRVAGLPCLLHEEQTRDTRGPPASGARHASLRAMLGTRSGGREVPRRAVEPVSLRLPAATSGEPPAAATDG